jgi:hypothetical protein
MDHHYRKSFSILSDPQVNWSFKKNFQTVCCDFVTETSISNWHLICLHCRLCRLGREISIYAVAPPTITSFRDSVSPCQLNLSKPSGFFTYHQV